MLAIKRLAVLSASIWKVARPIMFRCSDEVAHNDSKVYTRAAISVGTPSIGGLELCGKEAESPHVEGWWSEWIDCLKKMKKKKQKERSQRWEAPLYRFNMTSGETEYSNTLSSNQVFHLPSDQDTARCLRPMMCESRK